mgnify:FL=1
MRLVYTLVLACLAYFLSAQNQVVDSKITEVTVFSQGAQVTRTVEISLKAGEQTLLFNNVALSVDAESLQLTQVDNAEWSLHQLKHQVQYLSHDRAFLDSLAYLNKALNKTNKDLTALKEQYRKSLVKEKVLLANTNYEKSSNQVSTLEQGLNLIDQKMERFRKERALLDDQIHDQERKQQELLNALLLKRLEQSSPKGQIIVKISSPVAQKTMLKLTYFVESAGWEPVYDLQMTSPGEPLKIVYKAQIQQTSGEPWKDVKLSLGTAKPTQGLDRPELRPFEVGNLSYNTRTRGTNTRPQNEIRGTISGLIYNSSTNQPAQQATILAYNKYQQVVGASTSNVAGQFQIALKQPAQKLLVISTGYQQKEVYLNPNQKFYEIDFNPTKKSYQTTAEDITHMAVRDISSVESSVRGARSEGTTFFINGVKIKGATKVPKEVYNYGAFERPASGTNLNFTLNKPFSLSSNGESLNVVLKALEVPANFQYLLIPKKSKESFLVAEISDYNQLNLLVGKSNIYVNQTFLGSSTLDPFTPKDTLSLNMGVDPRLRAQRTLIKQKTSKSAFSGDKTREFTYQVEIQNTFDDSIRVKLIDQIPISKSEPITVKLLEAEGAQYTNATGELEWKLQMAPGEKRKLTFQYEIKYPGNVRINH